MQRWQLLGQISEESHQHLTKWYLLYNSDTGFWFLIIPQLRLTSSVRLYTRDLATPSAWLKFNGVQWLFRNYKTIFCLWRRNISFHDLLIICKYGLGVKDQSVGIKYIVLADILWSSIEHRKVIWLNGRVKLNLKVCKIIQEGNY